MADHRKRRRWRRWVFLSGPSPYSPRIQVICTMLTLVWLAGWLGIPYLLGVTWPWHYGRLTGPVLVLMLYVPMVWWLDGHGHYDETRMRRYYDENG